MGKEKFPRIEDLINQLLKCGNCKTGSNFLLKMIFAEASNLIEKGEVVLGCNIMESLASMLFIKNRFSDVKKIHTFLHNSAKKMKDKGRFHTANTVLDSSIRISRVLLNDPLRLSLDFKEAAGIARKALSTPGCSHLAIKPLLMIINFGYKDHHSEVIQTADMALSLMKKAKRISQSPEKTSSPSLH